MNGWQYIGLLLRTVSRLPPKQIFWRLANGLKRNGRALRPVRVVPVRNVQRISFFYGFAGQPGDADGALGLEIAQGFQGKLNPVEMGQLGMKPMQEALFSRADAIQQRQFVLGTGDTFCFADKVDWDLVHCDYRLCVYRLNAFDFLLTLSDAFSVSRDSRYLETGLSLMEAWSDQAFERPQGLKWNAYVIAKRLRNWIGFISLYGDRLEGERLQLFQGRIAAQAKVLQHSVEYHLSGNHLLTEGNALAFAGHYLGDAKGFEMGTALLIREMGRQFLGDGGHYERSMSYHIEAMQQCLELAALLEMRKDERVEQILAVMAQAYGYLRIAMRPGSLPLLSDSAADYPMDARDFLYACALLFRDGAFLQKAEAREEGFIYGYRWFRGLQGLVSKGYEAFGQWPVKEWKNRDPDKGPFLFGQTGYLFDAFEWKGHRVHLCMDVGPVGAEDNPGHGHADMLSLLCWVDGRPVFVDAGAYTYQPGQRRDAYRGTAAHNTVEMDGSNSAEVWGAFRLGRRGTARVIGYCPSARGTLEITAVHDGYRRMLAGGGMHFRTLWRSEAHGVLAVVDKLTGQDGKKHRALRRFYMAPEQCVECKEEGQFVLTGCGRFLSTHATRLGKGQVSQCMGSAQQTHVLETEVEFHGVGYMAAVLCLDDSCSLSLSPEGLLWMGSDCVDLFGSRIDEGLGVEKSEV